MPKAPPPRGGPPKPPPGATAKALAAAGTKSGAQVAVPKSTLPPVGEAARKRGTEKNVAAIAVASPVKSEIAPVAQPQTTESGARAIPPVPALSGTQAAFAAPASALGGAAAEPPSDVTMRPPGHAPGDQSAPLPLPGPTDDAGFEVSLDSSIPPRMSIGPSAPPAVARFGRYHLLGRLAVGGMAEIFLAREETAGGGSRNVVIKLAREQFVDLTGFETMFTDEGRLAMRLAHPNICHLYEFGKEGGRFFMALEWVNGVSMRDLTRRARSRGQALPVGLVVKAVSQVAEALDSAHRTRDGRGRPLNIVHRDVSPHNVMVSYDGVVKLLDFGIAKGRNTKETTVSGTVKGKFNYMSPQQCSGRSVDGRADIFSLGVCLWEALVAKSLFKRETQYETFKAIIEDDVPLVSSLRDDVPAELDEIIQKAVAKELSDRYRTAAEFHEALERFLQQQGEIVSSASIGSYLETLFEEEIAAGPQLDTSDEIVQRIVAQASAGPSELAATSTPPAKRSVVVPIAAAAVLVLVLGLSLFAALSDPENHDTLRRPGSSSGGASGATVDEPDLPVPDEGEEPVGSADVVEVPDPGVEVRAGDGDQAPPVAGDEVGDEDEDVPADEPEARSGRDEGADRADRRRSGRRTPMMRRSMGAGFVSDPGF